MLIKEIMTTSPKIASTSDSLRTVAELMAEGDFGSVAVVDDEQRPQGVITDRDIAVRAVARGLGPDTQVGEIMTADCVCVGDEDSAAAACDLMQERRVRRLLAIDGDGRLCGIVATADLAPAVPRPEAGEVLRDVSEPAS